MPDGIDRAVDTAFPVWRYSADGWSAGEDAVAEEIPLTVRLDGEEFVTVVCSPQDTEDLVFGFLAGEGIIASPEDIERIDWDEAAGFADVRLRRRLDGAEADFGRRVIGSCCGRSRQFYFRSDVRTARTSISRVRMRPEECLAAMAELQRRSAEFARTGGVHNAALWSPGRGLIAMRTDIGRHNALDKLLGYCLRRGIPTRDAAIIFSGRISSEVLLKTAKIGAAILIAKSAPTGLALRLAHDLGITAAGFVRGGRMNVYTHPERLGAAEPSQERQP
ncbi:MAG: formate dehydrogenase accessory sulfurtransferase FdhD [Thermobacillus sp.]|uniref:formate dehydrogenase accessory sulfurtransferase FdhD n=1 Tax=Thermobacillus sp. TaxID=2108467 RepID=UPI000E3B247A|nr:formate dehydrogenase accessory sulfurtransferase FdhD [Thermobacillus sp.]REK53722.1 MAG: formate dehydrogenase accessory sulfurtransferase FdhD [Thermobacillus sp.]